MAKPIRILIVDSHKIARNGLASFIDVFDDLELAGQAGDGQTALALCADLQPDVVITELKLPNVDGITLTHRITQYYPQVKVVALDIVQQPEMIEAVLRAGASLYLTKEVHIDELAKAIREVVNGKRSRPRFAWA